MIGIDDPRCSRCGARIADLDREDCPKCGRVLDYSEVIAGALPCLYCREPISPGNLMCPHCGREDPHCTRRRSVSPVLFLSLGRFVRRRAWLIIVIAVAAWAFFR